MKTTRILTFFSRVLFFIAVSFTAIFFVDTWRTPFFLNFHYKALKFVLCVLVPFAASFINYICEKNFNFAGKASAVISAMFIAGYIIDQLTVKWISCFGSFVIIFHLVYGLLSIFSVFLCCTVIKYFTSDKDNNYNTFFNDFFLGFGVMLAFIFILMYFVIRNYDNPNISVNLIPFQGEIKTTLTERNKYSVVRSMGNVFFYSAISIAVIRISKHKKLLFAVAVPIVLSIGCEILQYVFNCGDTDIDDIIMNTAGVIIGIAFYKIIIEPLLITTRSKLC